MLIIQTLLTLAFAPIGAIIVGAAKVVEHYRMVDEYDEQKQQKQNELTNQ